jgi:uncharacterized protein (UPF0332 family)
MTQEEKQSLIQYRLEKAYDYIAEAECLANSKLWNGVASRLYYACFHALHAIFLRDDFFPLTHVGVRSILGQHYAKTKIISTELSRLYNLLLNKRELVDYKLQVRFEEDEILPLLAQTRRFVETIESLTKSIQS